MWPYGIACRSSSLLVSFVSGYIGHLATSDWTKILTLAFPLGLPCFGLSEEIDRSLSRQW